MTYQIRKGALTPETAVKLARLIVERWESADERAEGLRKYGVSDDAIRKVADDFRTMIGGQELYEACKAYLASLESPES